VLRQKIADATAEIAKVAQDFEALYKEDRNLIDLITNDEIRALLLQPGAEKYDLLFG
jgi:hypothetical protein